MEFSQRVLARAPQALAVLAVSNLQWSDLGDPQRVLSLLKRIAHTGQREQLRERHPGTPPANAPRRVELSSAKMRHHLAREQLQVLVQCFFGGKPGGHVQV